MKILIVSPAAPTAWNLNRTLNFITRKPKFPPKELLLISVLLPITWERKTVDLNNEKLKKKDILWADYIFIHANEKQYKSTIKNIAKFSSFGKKVVGCGSLFTTYFEEFENIEHLVLDNIRTTLPQFIYDLENVQAKKTYHSNPFFEIRQATESYYSITSLSGKLLENIHFA